MKVRIDEAGDFNYANLDRFRVSVLAGLVIPDGQWDAVQRSVHELAASWGVDELKANAMNTEQLMVLARLVADHELTVAAIATDARIFTAEAQRRWRDRQTAVFLEAVDRSTRAKNDPDVVERVGRTRRRINHDRHIKQPNFLQYGILAPWLLAHLTCAALYAYRDLPPDLDSWLMDYVVDAKEGADPGKAGKLLRDNIEYILVRDPRTSLFVPPEWPVDHPFKVRNRDWEQPVISPRKVFADGIVSDHSHLDAGLQLADFVAHVIWSVIRNPGDAASDVWALLARRVMPTPEGPPIKVWAWPAENLPEDDVRPYERLAELAPQTLYSGG